MKTNSMCITREVRAWIARQLGVQPLRVSEEPLVGGLSNLTWKVLVDGQVACVFRQPPQGVLLRTAHDLGREFRMLEALRPTGFPVPEPIGVLEDESGSPSYLMSYVEGHALANAGELREWSGGRNLLTALGSSASTLAQLHSLVPANLGLDRRLGSESYTNRQLHRWLAQWEQIAEPIVVEVPAIHERLVNSQPEPTIERVVHGDFHFGNLLLSADGSVVAVLDWELATVGESAADLGSYLAYLDADLWGWRLSAGLGTEGDWAEAAHALRNYGAEVSSERVRFYLALAHWKLACIGEGIVARNLGRDRAQRSVDLAHVASQTRAHAAAAANLFDQRAADSFDVQLQRAVSQEEIH